jgi:hypothetical protein
VHQRSRTCGGSAKIAQAPSNPPSQIATAPRGPSPEGGEARPPGAPSWRILTGGHRQQAHPLPVRGVSDGRKRRRSPDAIAASPARLALDDMTVTMNQKGNGWTEACIDSWPALLKKAWVHLRPRPTRAEARAALFEYIAVFNHWQRLHDTLGYRTLRHAAAAAPTA